MLEITIPKFESEYFDEKTERFIKISTKETKLQLEHSLIAIKKWEQIWHKPFLDDTVDKTPEEMISYIECMTLNHVDDRTVYSVIPKEIFEIIGKYIKDPMTATWFGGNNSFDHIMGMAKEKVTAEIIYYWIFSLGLPIDLQKWHINQLLTLIKVFNIKNGKPKKESKRETISRIAAENARRRAIYNSKG